MRPHTHSITRGQMPGSLHSRRLHRESCALKQVGGSIYSHQREREVGSRVGSRHPGRPWGGGPWVGDLPGDVLAEISLAGFS